MYDPLLNVERTETGVDDPVGAGDAALVRQPAAVAELLIESQVELRLARATIPERRSDRAVAIVGIARAANRGAWNARIGDHRDGAGRPRDTRRN